ncbi:peroxiredoxin [Henriciella marina]|uniref:Peroxiredoxin n=1 Tax=Henriciella marina TaxID=453851 RepID=A0ABT4LYE9_9PROT|nr:peroxiredoxin [Henriciella marina]MCZ4298169.1 peroxiredoxin [Henriciella marina]
MEGQIMLDIASTNQVAQIGSAAPDFDARTTEGLVRLSDYRGRWLVFFSHPADFTPVCTSEFVAFEKQIEAFNSLDCDLLGLSVDSLYSHLAWVKDIEARFGVRISFPIVEDISMAIARAYGMIHAASDSTASVRSVFFIDPEGIIRALIHYPLAVGRSVDEIFRVLAALQTSETAGVSTPEGWRPGDDAVLPAPTDMRQVDERAAMEGHAWYLTSKGGQQ